MCTLVVLNRVHPEFPVVLAANRDELFARESEGPQVLSQVPRIVGGRDGIAGGTWLGLTPRGFFVGVTNLAGTPPRPGFLSRGQLVLDMLRHGATAAAEGWLRAQRPEAYNPFNVMWGDASGVRVAHARGPELEVVDVPPGVHVLPNDRLDAPRVPRVARAQALLSELNGDLDTQLAGVLSDDAVCVRGDVYGTRSASLVGLRPGGVAFYRHADGAPDEAPFEDFTWLLS